MRPVTDAGAPALGPTPTRALEGLRAPPRRAWFRYAAVVTLWVLIATLALRALPRVRDAALRQAPCFAVYYTLARLFVQGGGLAATYDDAAFAVALDRVQPGLVDVNVNPPTTALLALPLAALKLPTARAVWTAANVALLLAVSVWAAREAGLSGAWIFMLVGAAIVSEPVVANLQLGQAYIAMFALEVAAWHAYRRDHPRTLGVILGAMVALKLAGVLLLLLLVADRRWRALAWSAGGAAALCLAVAPWSGLAAWPAFINALVRATRAPEATVTAYQALAGAIRHLTTLDPRWNPAPLFRAATAGAWAAAGIVAAAAASLFLLARRGCISPERRFAVFAAAGVALTPLALDYHYALLILPFALVAGSARRPTPWPYWLGFATAALLVGADLPYVSPRLAVGAWALLAYPKLCGAALLSAVALLSPTRDSQPGEPHVSA